jgi:hypothetical protein
MSCPTLRQQPKFPKKNPIAPIDQDNDTSLVIDETTPPPPDALFAGRIPRKPKPGPSVVEQIMGAVVEDVEMMDPKPEDHESEEEEFVYGPREVIKELGKFAREGKIRSEQLTWRFDCLLGDILEEKDPDYRAYELETAVRELMNKPLPRHLDDINSEWYYSKPSKRTSVEDTDSEEEVDPEEEDEGERNENFYNRGNEVDGNHSLEVHFNNALFCCSLIKAEKHRCFTKHTVSSSEALCAITEKDLHDHMQRVSRSAHIPLNITLGQMQKVLSLMHYVQDFKRIGEPVPFLMPTQHEEPPCKYPFQQDDLEEAAHNACICTSIVENASIWAKANAPGPFTGGALKFNEWDEMFTNYLSGLPSISGTIISRRLSHSLHWKVWYFALTLTKSMDSCVDSFVCRKLSTGAPMFLEKWMVGLICWRFELIMVARATHRQCWLRLVVSSKPSIIAPRSQRAHLILSSPRVNACLNCLVTMVNR